MEAAGSAFGRSRSDFRPAFLALYRSGELERRAAAARELQSPCRVCPRCCEVDRNGGRVGVCRTGARARVASAFAHFGEEACLSGRKGSGTIFFSWCNLRCVFCQNSDLSWDGSGEELACSRIAELMLGLQARGCHNINLVSPSHVVPQILEALVEAAGRGLRVPLVYNTNAYDRVETLRLLDGVVDIYMPDFKYWDSESARRFSLAADYPERACAAVREMHRQVGDLVLDEEGIALRGLLVRHLVLPGNLAGTREVMRFLSREISPSTFVNVMAQYRPAGRVLRRPGSYEPLARSLGADEYLRALAEARAAGLERLDRH